MIFYQFIQGRQMVWENIEDNNFDHAESKALSIHPSPQKQNPKNACAHTPNYDKFIGTHYKGRR